jgi:hypothetical protein
MPTGTTRATATNWCRSATYDAQASRRDVTPARSESGTTFRQVQCGLRSLLFSLDERSVRLGAMKDRRQKVDIGFNSIWRRNMLPPPSGRQHALKPRRSAT